MDTRATMVCVLVSLAACGGTNRAKDTGTAGTLVDWLVEQGTWVEDARYLGRLVSSGCQDCAEVFLYRFERNGTGLRLSIDLFYDHAPAGHVDGEKVCTAIIDIDILHVAGPDPAARAFTQETLVQKPICFGEPALSTQTWAALGADAMASWRTHIPDETFPGWHIEGKRAYRVVPCPASAHADGRDYCRPSCDAGAGGAAACRYGPGPADPAPEQVAASCDLVPGWNAIVVGGDRREVYLAAPRIPDPSRKLPVAFVWHGGGGDPVNELDVSGLGKHAIEGDALSLAPVARDNEALPIWDDLHDNSPDLALYDALHDCLPHLGADPDRVFSTGMSAGGFFTANLLLRRSTQLRAAAVFSAGMRPPWQPTAGHPPVLLAWGGASDSSACARPDGSVGPCNYSEEIASMAANLKANGQQVILCNHAGGHTYPPTGPTLVWDLMTASELPLKGLPSGWPTYCKIDR